MARPVPRDYAVRPGDESRQTTRVAADYGQPPGPESPAMSHLSRWQNRIAEGIDRVAAISDQLQTIGDDLFGELPPSPPFGTVMGQEQCAGRVAVIDEELHRLHEALGLLEEQFARLVRLT